MDKRMDDWMNKKQMVGWMDRKKQINGWKEGLQI